MFFLSNVNFNVNKAFGDEGPQGEGNGALAPLNLCVIGVIFEVWAGLLGNFKPFSKPLPQ